MCKKQTGAKSFSSLCRKLSLQKKTPVRGFPDYKETALEDKCPFLEDKEMFVMEMCEPNFQGDEKALIKSTRGE